MIWKEKTRNNAEKKGGVEMIRQYKHKEAPEGLRRCGRGNKNIHDMEDVCLQLLADHHNLCYLCGRKLTIDYEIDHLRSRRERPRLRNSWRNLMLCCRYCNVRKGHKYNNILDPLNHDIENLIYQAIDPIKGKGVFRATGENPSREVLETIELLETIYNGRERFRTTKEQRFFNYAKEGVNEFRELCERWLKSKDLKVYSAICRELRPDSELLGFKYWIVRRDARLNTYFGGMIKWNRRI